MRKARPRRVHVYRKLALKNKVANGLYRKVEMFVDLQILGCVWSWLRRALSGLKIGLQVLGDKENGEATLL